MCVCVCVCVCLCVGVCVGVGVGVWVCYTHTHTHTPTHKHTHTRQAAQGSKRTSKHDALLVVNMQGISNAGGRHGPRRYSSYHIIAQRQSRGGTNVALSCHIGEERIQVRERGHTVPASPAASLAVGVL